MTMASVDDESGGNGEGHQGEVVEAVAEGVHGGEGCRSGIGARATLGIIVAERFLRNRNITMTTRPMVRKSSNSTSETECLDGRGEVRKRGDVDALGKIAFRVAGEVP